MVGKIGARGALAAAWALLGGLIVGYSYWSWPLVVSLLIALVYGYGLARLVVGYLTQ